MHTTVVQVTPDMARQWLENTAGQLQRPRSEARVQKWLAEIDAGNWKLTHQGIALDKNQVIIDGQHRLEAGRRSGKTLPMQVTFDADPETFSVIDVGAMRTPGDILHLAGFGSNVKALAASARLLILVDAMYADGEQQGSTFWSRRSMITPQMLVDLMESPRGDTLMAQSTMADRFARTWGMPGVRTWMQTTLTLLHESKTPEDLRLEFIERLLDGMYLSPGTPVAILRRLLTGDSYRSWNNNDKVRNGIACTITAYNDYLLGNPREVLRYRADRTFPKIINFKEAMQKKEQQAKAREDRDDQERAS